MEDDLFVSLATGKFDKLLGPRPLQAFVPTGNLTDKELNAHWKTVQEIIQKKLS